LKARYFRTVDTKDWKGFRAVFTEDVQIGPLENGLPEHLLALRPAGTRNSVGKAGLDGFMARLEATMASVISTHHGHQPEIRLIGPGEAEGIWAMEDVLVWPDAGYRFRGTGHYWETYRKVAGQWRISSIRLTRIYAYTEKINLAD
jgi:hypothetical protein